MLKVLLVYYEPIPSGQTTHVLSLARALDRQKHQVTVLLPICLQASVAAFRQAKVEVKLLPYRKVLWSPRAIAAMVGLIRREKVDLVHVHSQEAGLLARIIARAAGARALIYTPQVIDIRLGRWHWLYVLLERVLARLTDVIIASSESDRKRLIQWGIPLHKVVAIPNGLELAAFQEPADRDELRRELGLDVNKPLVMQVGRLSAQKAPLAFVEGAALVARECPDAQFVLMGEGPLQNEVTARIRELRLGKCVHLLGWRDKGLRFMPAAEVLTLTSLWEGMPYTLLEAMAWSRPVVANEVNGCVELVLNGTTGFLVPAGDVKAWAGRVIDLLNNPAQATAMGQRGREQLEEHFSLRGMVAQIEKIYSKAVQD